MVKYTGAGLVLEAGAPRCCDLEDFLLGDFLVSDGYGNGVFSFGAWV